MYEWFWGIFAKKSKLHDAGGPDTVVSPNIEWLILRAASNFPVAYSMIATET